MSPSALSKHAGPIAIVVGALFAVTQIVGFFLMDHSDLRSQVTNPLYQVNMVAGMVAFAGLVIAAVALYGWHARRAGPLGAIGLCGAIIGTMFVGGDWWFETFAIPWYGDVVPQVLDVRASGLLLFGAVTGFILFALGWVLFGVSGLRPRVFPPAACIAIIVGGLAGIQAATPPWGVPLALALIWTGASLMRTSVAGDTYQSVEH